MDDCYSGQAESGTWQVTDSKIGTCPRAPSGFTKDKISLPGSEANRSIEEVQDFLCMFVLMFLEGFIIS